MGNEEQKIYEDEPVSKLLGGLKRVEAPGDFDFGVKARIAKGKPRDGSTSWVLLTVRYTVSLVLLVFVGAYFAFNAFYGTRKVEVPIVAEVPAINNAPLSEPASNKEAVLPPNQLAVSQG